MELPENSNWSDWSPDPREFNVIGVCGGLNIIFLKSSPGDYNVQPRLRTPGLILVAQGLEHYMCSIKGWQINQDNNS